MNGQSELRRAYGALLRAAWIRALEYRAQVLLWVLTSVFPLVMMVVWLAIVEEAGPVTGWGEADFFSYYVAAALVNQITFSWTIWQWNDEIRTGNLSMKLLKPLDPVHHYWSEQIGMKVFVLLVLGPVLVIVAWLSPLINYPFTVERFLAFAISLVAGFALSALMTSAFGMLAFWSTQSNNLFNLWWGAGSFLSGWIAPLALFPPVLRQIAFWLPFRSTLSFPIEIVTGRLTWAETAVGFAVTFAWIAFFWASYRWLWRLGLRKYEAVGA